MSNNIEQPYSPYVRATSFSPVVRVVNKIKRNVLCPFTNLKFKKCCGKSNQNFCDKSIDSLNDHLKNFSNEKDEPSC